MNTPVPDPACKAETDAIGSPVFEDAVRVEIPPEQRKIDPSTIWWPEGVPKPWEKKPPADGGA
jgi:hypothetical protein